MIFVIYYVNIVDDQQRFYLFFVRWNYLKLNSFYAKQLIGREQQEEAGNGGVDMNDLKYQAQSTMREVGSFMSSFTKSLRGMFSL